MRQRVFEKIKSAYKVLLGKASSCEHEWRPCLIYRYDKDHPARICLWCKVTEEISEQDLYAQFGEFVFSRAKKGKGGL